MMIRVNDEYLDFNDFVEVERMVKLFEEIDVAAGDFSYQFTIPKTSKNISVLSQPFPDNSTKTTYQAIPCEILTDDGIDIRRGTLRIERITDVFECSFFSGNSNWFRMLVGNMTDLDLSKYDIEQTRDNIVSSWANTNGIVFPLIDTGGLSTRSYQNPKIEDFTPCFYVKTLFKEVFQQSGLKIAGEILNDYLFNKIVIASNGRSKTQIDNRKSFVQKTSVQTIPASGDPTETVTFDNDSIYPYFDGSQDNFSLVTNRYTADIGMILTVTYSFNFTVTGFIGFSVYINGAVRKADIFGGSAQTSTKTYRFRLQPGDYVEIRTGAVGISSGTVDSGTITLTPVFLYKAFGNATVPFWTKQEFISNYLRIFNIVPAYDPFTKTVTFNFFDKIKEKEPIDLSEYFTTETVDYIDFIQNYGKSNNFKYQDPTDEDLRQYNITEFIRYGAGVLPSNNEFIQDSADVIESDFGSPISYINKEIGASLERIEYITLEEDENTEFSSVADVGGNAEFTIGDEIFLINDLVRVSDSSVPAYNGDYVVSNVGSGTIRLRGNTFEATATGTLTRLVHSATTDDTVYMFVFVGDYDYSDYSSKGLIFIDGVSYPNIGPAYFNLLANGQQIENEYIQGLSFGVINDPLFFQRTILQSYWDQFSRIINDPVKIIGIAYLPLKLYQDIDFLRPIFIKTLETSNLYYLNKDSGYGESHLPCTVELIKLP